MIRYRYFFPLLILVADQLSKFWVMDFLNVAPVVRVTSFFNLVHVHNTGVSFGLFSGYGDVGKWALVALTGAIMVMVAKWLAREQKNMLIFAYGLILGGAAGNLLDRLMYGGVRDFLDFYVMLEQAYHWPAFNLADSAIVVGVMVLFYDLLRGNAKHTK